jgi:hypothetical protein
MSGKSNVHPLTTFFAILLFSTAVGAESDIGKSIYLNTVYCQGVAESYSSRLGDAGSAHRSGSRRASRIAGALEVRGEEMARRFQYSEQDGEEARARGSRTIEGMLPRGGAWENSGDVPISAFRQFQQCVSIVE